MTDEQRATIFGGEADRYDRFRPSYPSEVIDLVADGQPVTAVDAGCGTGKAATLVMQRGIKVVGVEPDPRMADVARRHGVDVVVSTLEEWDAVPCDIMYSAQAWHWIDPRRGARVASTSIRSGGRWAAFWNYEIDTQFGEARDSVYRRLAPELVGNAASPDDDELRVPIADALAATNAFDDVIVDNVTWTDEVTVEVAVQRLASHSAHRLLTAERSEAINEALRHVLGSPTDSIVLGYITRFFTATRR